MEGTPQRRVGFAADGKIIKAGAVSVQSNLTYEKEFALEMEKAKVRPGPSLCHGIAVRPSFAGVRGMYDHVSMCGSTGGEGEKHTVGFIIQSSTRDPSW